MSLHRISFTPVDSNIKFAVNNVFYNNYFVFGSVWLNPITNTSYNVANTKLATLPVASLYQMRINGCRYTDSTDQQVGCFIINTNELRVDNNYNLPANSSRTSGWRLLFIAPITLITS